MITFLLRNVPENDPEPNVPDRFDLVLHCSRRYSKALPAASNPYHLSHSLHLVP